ncbi:TPA: glycosyltransferase [Photobacterium damselae]
MNVLLLNNYNDPRTIGGIQSFIRVLYDFFPDKSLSISLFEEIDNIIYDDPRLLFCFKKYSLTLRVLNRLFLGRFYDMYLKYKINNINHDVVIMASPLELKYYSRKKSNVKKILVQHTMPDRMYNSELYFNSDDLLLQRCRDEINILIALSEYDREIFISKYGFDKDKVKVIRHPSLIPNRREYKKKNKNLIIISRLDNTCKRIDLAIEGMSSLPDFNLHIYGDGPDEYKLKKMVNDNNCNNIFFHGSTSNIAEKLDENSIFIMTSDLEGYGITLIEAMRRGLPIILRDTYPAAKDIIFNNGVLLDKKWNKDEFSSAVKFCFDNYDELSLNSLKQGERHDFSIIEKSWHSIMNGL